MYRTVPDGGPDAKNTHGVGGPAGCEEVAKRCAELNRTVGPTLKTLEVS
jgi:hypothetical protein